MWLIWSMKQQIVVVVLQFLLSLQLLLLLLSMEWMDYGRITMNGSLYPSHTIGFVHAFVVESVSRNVYSSFVKKSTTAIGTIVHPPQQTQQAQCRFSLVRLSSTYVDYEYIPPFDDSENDDNNENEDDIRRSSSTSSTASVVSYEQQLQRTIGWAASANKGSFATTKWIRTKRSVYPSGTPATLRGEAVRSAIRSGRCVGWIRDYDQDDNNNNNSNEFGSTTVASSPVMPKASNPSPLVLSLSGPGTIDFLNSKFTQSFSTSSQTYSNSLCFRSACFLNAKGHLIDVVGVAVSLDATASSPVPNMQQAYLMSSSSYSISSPTTTSKNNMKDSPNYPNNPNYPNYPNYPIYPNNPIKYLYDKLNQYIFPLDRVQLKGLTNTVCFSFQLFSTDTKHIQRVIDHYIIPNLPVRWDLKGKYSIPLSGDVNQCTEIPLQQAQQQKHHDSSASTQPDSSALLTSSAKLLIVPFTDLTIVPNNACGSGYQFTFLADDGNEWAASVGRDIWYRVLLQDPDGPIEIGPAELDSLRIECAVPAFGQEMTAASASKKRTKTNQLQSAPDATNVSTEQQPTSLDPGTPASPLELLFSTTTTSPGGIIDLTKGCYLGQEGIASIIKNKRGPPRILYQVVFDDEFNDYTSTTSTTSTTRTLSNSLDLNPTRVPVPGDRLYVLGSNEAISVGRITSVAEPGSTGDPITIALALVRRPQSIIQQMKSMEIQLPSSLSSPSALSNLVVDDNGSGIIRPPPLLNSSNKDDVDVAASILDGLEVIIGSTYTVGRLQMVPSRRFKDIIFKGSSVLSSSLSFTSFSMFANVVPSYVENLSQSTWTEDARPNDDSLVKTTAIPVVPEKKSNEIRNFNVVVVVDESIENHSNDDDDIHNSSDDDTEENTLEKIIIQAEKEAKEAAIEAQRKIAKMETLKRQAEQALLRRKQKQQQQQSSPNNS